MGGQMDRQYPGGQTNTDEWTEGQMNRHGNRWDRQNTQMGQQTQTSRQTDKKTHRRVYRWTDIYQGGKTDDWMDRKTNTQTNGQMDKEPHRQMDRQTHR
jgi:hypothetical protein